MESSSLGQFLSTDLVTPGSVPPSVASSEDSSNDCAGAPWKADSVHMNGSRDSSPHTTIFHTDQLAELPRSIARPSRESVLQRLSESLLRRSLTKVGGSLLRILIDFRCFGAAILVSY